MMIGALGEEAAQVGPGMLARRSGEPGQIGGDGSVELVSGRPGVSGDWGSFMLDHYPTVRSPEAGGQCRFDPSTASRGPAAEGRTRPITDSVVPYRRGMAKASRVLAALKRDGWIETRRSGSHRVLVKGDQQRIWAYHDGVDLGGPALARIARDYGYTVDELRKL